MSIKERIKKHASEMKRVLFDYSLLSSTAI